MFLCSLLHVVVAGLVWQLELSNWYLKLGQVSLVHGHFGYWCGYLYSVVSDLNGWLVFCLSNGIMMRFGTLDSFSIV